MSRIGDCMGSDLVDRLFWCRCDGYNVGTASAFLLFLAFGFSIFFDVKDLHASKASPRTRP